MVENRSVSLKSFVKPACLEQVLQARDEGADKNPRVGKRTLEPAGLSGTVHNRGLEFVRRAMKAAAHPFYGAIERLLVGGSGAYIFFETIVHTISLYFSLLCVNLATNRLKCNHFCKSRFTVQRGGD